MAARTIDRYTLRALVSSVDHPAGAIELWQGYDPVLDRPVSIRLVPLGHPRVEAVAAAARDAALVDERRLVAVLDVLPDATDSEAGSDAVLAIVSEWVDGYTLADLLEDRDGETLDSGEALAIVREAAAALDAARRRGVAHGRLRPGSVLLAGALESDPLAGEVRIRGLAIDAALWGATDPASAPGREGAVPGDAPPVDPDVHGLGCLLYAAVTGRWPNGLADGLSPAPRLSDRLVPPSQVVADVPRIVDDLTWRCLDPRTIGEWPLPRGLTSFPDTAAVAMALGAADTDGRTARALPSLPSLPRPTRQPGRAVRILRRGAAALVAAAAIAGLAVVGLQVTGRAASPWGVNAEPVSADVLTAAPAIPTSGNLADLTAGQVPGSYRIASITDFDPFGDGSENSDEVELSVDGNPVTSWTTETYYSPDLGGTGGVGLVIDLGTPQPVSAVRLDLEGFGSGIDVRVGSSPDAAPNRWVELASAEGIGETIDLRAPRPVVGQYVLIWFTTLPPDSGAFRGGIREVAVLA